MDGKTPDTPQRHIVLVRPEIHWNTGNIGRTCLGASASLHLIMPLGFSLDSRQVKRAGLDYWDQVCLRIWDSFEEFEEKMKVKPEEACIFAKAGSRSFRLMPSLLDRMFLIFGSETRGLPIQILEKYAKNVYHIPVSNKIRSLNLSTAAGIALYESLRNCDPVHKWPDPLKS